MSTVTINGVELFCAGTHNRDFYDLADLQGMITAAGQVGFTPPVKIGHMSDNDTDRLLKAEGLPAFGWIRNLRMRGNKLVGDLCDVPRRVADLIKNGAYKRLSAEIYWNFTQNGRSWPRVLKAVSLLGAEIPAVTSLKDVEALYGMQAYAAELPPGRVKVYQGDIMVIPAMAEDDESDDESFQKDKSSVDYRLSEDPTERCGTCCFFLGASQHGSVGVCRLVDGEIAADALCDLYEIREAYDFEERVTEQSNRAAAVGDQPPTWRPWPHATEEERTMRTWEEEGRQATEEKPSMADIYTERAEAGQELDRLVRRYLHQHRETARTYEQAFRLVRAQRPDLIAAYLARPAWPAADVVRRSVGDEVALKMKEYQAALPGASDEDACRAVLKADPVLRDQYLGVATRDMEDRA